MRDKHYHGPFFMIIIEMSAERFKENIRGQYRDKSIRQLEQELRTLKQKEKYYLKLSQRVKQLEQKSRKIKRASDDIAPDHFDDQQIERLKVDIERTLAQTKRIDQDNRIIKDQTKSLENQVKALEGVYSSICNDNKNRRLRIQLRDEQLMEKENEVESLIQRRNCNQLVIEELRAEITKLQDEENVLKQQLQALRLQRQEEEKEKERLRSALSLCKKETIDQQRQGQEHRVRLAQIKQANYIVKQQLITLIKLEDKLKAQLQGLISNYHNTVALEAESKRKVCLLEDELNSVEEDLQLLTDEYLKENAALREDQQLNQSLNHELDQLAKEVLSTWEHVRQLIDIQDNPDSELKTKAHRLWIQISQILSLK